MPTAARQERAWCAAVLAWHLHAELLSGEPQLLEHVLLQAGLDASAVAPAQRQDRKKGTADTCHAHGLQQSDLIQGMCPHLLASASASLSLPVFMMVT